MKCENCGGLGTHHFEKTKSCKGYIECYHCGCKKAKAIGLVEHKIKHKALEEDIFTRAAREKGRPLNKYELMWLM